MNRGDRFINNAIVVNVARKRSKYSPLLTVGAAQEMERQLPYSCSSNPHAERYADLINHF